MSDTANSTHPGVRLLYFIAASLLIPLGFHFGSLTFGNAQEIATLRARITATDQRLDHIERTTDEILRLLRKGG
ncbi:MAG: hypothetical protein KGJ13_06910 [Patescibacteria group bacterium]|nr:hypothetical protein [Patescibacteria group bacterium]